MTLHSAQLFYLHSRLLHFAGGNAVNFH